METQADRAAKLPLLPKIKTGRGWQGSSLPVEHFGEDHSARTDELFAEVIDELLAENLEIQESLIVGLPVEAYLA